MARNTERCSRCRRPNDRSPQRYCSRCHADYQRDWRAGMHWLSEQEWAIIRAMRMTEGARAAPFSWWRRAGN